MKEGTRLRRLTEAEWQLHRETLEWLDAQGGGPCVVGQLLDDRNIVTMIEEQCDHLKNGIPTWCAWVPDGLPALWFPRGKAVFCPQCGMQAGDVEA